MVARGGYQVAARNTLRDYAMSRSAFFDRDVSQFGWSAVSPSRPAISQSVGRSGHQGPVLAVLAMLAAKRRLRASLDRRCDWRSVSVQAGTEKRRSNRTEKHKDQSRRAGMLKWSLQPNIN